MSIDANDKKTGWTSQQGALAEVDPEVNDPGMVYHRSQLPDPDVARAAGIPPQTEPEGVLDDADEAVKHPNGPTPSDLHWVDVKNGYEDLKDALQGKKDNDDNADNDVDVKPESKPADAPKADAKKDEKPAK